MSDVEEAGARLALSRRLARNALYTSGTTHEIAAKIVRDLGGTQKFTVANPTCGPQVGLFGVRYKNALDVLQELAAIGGECLQVTGDGLISFVLVN